MPVENLTPTPPEQLTSADQAMHLADSISTMMRNAVAALQQYATDAEARAQTAETRRATAEAAVADLMQRLKDKDQVQADLAALQTTIVTESARLDAMRKQTADLRASIAKL